MFLFAVSILPVYAQNVHLDEDEEKIRAKINNVKIKFMQMNH